MAYQMSVGMASPKSIGMSVVNECGHGASNAGADVTEKCLHESQKSIDTSVLNECRHGTSGVNTNVTEECQHKCTPVYQSWTSADDVRTIDRA